MEWLDPSFAEPNHEAAFFYGLFLRGHPLQKLREDIDGMLGNAAGAALGKYEVAFRRNEIGYALRYRAERIVFDCLSENPLVFRTQM